MRLFCTKGLAILATLVVMGCGTDGGQDDNQNTNNNNDNESQAVCGDGVIDPGEVCDDGAANSDSNPGACRTDCREAYCGDQVVDPGEDCEGEGEDVTGTTCEGLGYGEGPLTCRADCTVETTLCTGWVAVAAGTSHTCAIRPDGVVRCWGRNEYGQLGNGLYETSAEPVTVTGLDAAVTLAAGRNHTCAVVADGSAWCWGENNVGQLGDGTTTDSPVPVPVSDLTGVVGLSASHQDGVTCAVDDQGVGYCWGHNSDGQLGNDTNTDTDSAVPLQVSLTSPLRKISVGSSYACAVHENGDVSCWGYNWCGRIGPGPDGATPPTTVAGVSAVVDLAAMAAHTCAVDEFGDVWCWGCDGIAGSEGLLGRGYSIIDSSPDKVLYIDNAKTISGGMRNACALRENGSVWCWGGYRLGNGTAVESRLPVPVIGLEDATALSGGLGHYCALRDDHSLACWGNSGNGELGPGAPWDGDVPVMVAGLAGIQSITGSVVHTCAVAGELSAVFCWGGNDAGQLGNGTITSQTSPTGVMNLTHVVSVSAGNEHTCAARTYGTEPINRTAWCWGNGAHGSLGNGTNDAVLVPVQVLGLSNVEQVACGYAFSCARIDDGVTPASASCWGLGDDGRLGDGLNTTSVVPVTVGGSATPLTGITALSAGGHHACALIDDGSVWCWGNGANGRLGNGDTNNQDWPVQVVGLTDAVAVAAAKGKFTCAVRTTGEVLCWGSNSYGQLGDGTFEQRLTPMSVVGLSGAVSVAAGNSYACALLDDGSVWCWGSGASGQLGAGTTTMEPTPVKFQNPSPAIAVEVGTHHTCVIQQNGMTWCSGSNTEGQIGDSTRSGSLVPVPGPTL